jgi:site-specific DNA-methyltransferase (adenine-specific)
VKIRPWPEVQEILPPLAPLEREALRVSIEQDGVQQPILVLPDGRIVDGHHRWELSGGEAPQTILFLAPERAFELAIELNLSRRQLSREQMARVQKQLRKHREALRSKALEMRQEGMTQQEVADELAIPQQTLSDWENRTNTGIAITGISSIPDSRVKVPRGEHAIIYDRWQAGETQEDIALDYQVSQQAIGKICQKVQGQIEREQAAQEAVKQVQSATEWYTLLCGDFREVTETLEPESYDVIITDPPYPKKHLPLYELLAKQAARLLKPGGSLLAMAGQSYLPSILELMTRHLTYHWTISYLTPGGQSAQIWHRKINTFWKPVLWFVKGKYPGEWIGDVVKSAVNDNDKRFHEWGQSESGMADLIERFSAEGDHILDPFCGAGTTGVVAVKLKRQFTGIDIDPDAIAKSQLRIGAAVNES